LYFYDRIIKFLTFSIFSFVRISMGCTTSVPSTGGLTRTPEPEHPEDYAASDSGIEDSYSSESTEKNVSKALVQAKKERFATEDLQFLQKTFNEGVFAEIGETQLMSLWNQYSCQRLNVMKTEDMKKLLGDYIEFCRDFSSDQIKRRKYGEKGSSVRSVEELDLSRRASLTLVKCNSQRVRLQNLMEDLFGTKTLEWTKVDFLQRAEDLFFRVREELKMQPWADSLLGPVNYDAPTVEPGWVKDLQIQLAQEKLKGEFEEGCLRICIIGACGLIPIAGNETCTPYAILSVANSNVPTVFKHDTNDPEWMQTFKFTRYMFRKQSDKTSHVVKEKAHLHIMDWDKETRKAIKLGSVSFDLPNDFMEKSIDLELPIMRKKDEAKPGCVMISYILKTRDA